MKNTTFSIPKVIMGCMRMRSMETREILSLVSTAMELGITFFDHADVYAGGACEAKFAEALDMNHAKRERLILQSKCGIVKSEEYGAYYDLSKKSIIDSTKSILKRLRTDYLDILLLHRPDTLMEPEEIAAAFSFLHSRGMVRYFGVSNQNSMQIEMLQRVIEQKLIINQLQFSPVHSSIVGSGISVNMRLEQSVDHDGSILEYCRANDISIQAWSPFQKGFFDGVFLNDDEQYGELNRLIKKYAEQYGVTPSGIVVAWILRHPAVTQVVTGTTNAARLKECVDGASIQLSRGEWYSIYKAAGNPIP